MPSNITNPIIIAVDHGYGNIKTENTVFPASVTHCTDEPATATDKLLWNGQWYAIGEGHKEFLADKTADDDYRLLTMVAIAKELEYRGITEATVRLAVGLPLTWYAQQKESFRRYLTQLSIIEFNLNGVAYCVDIEGADVFMQGFAAVVDQLDTYTGVNMLCDIGNGTMSIMYINNCHPLAEKCFTEKFGTYQCTLVVREAVMQQLHLKVEDSVIEDVLCNNTASVSERVLEVIREAARKYVDQILRNLREHEYNPEMMRLHIMGGGACLIHHFNDLEQVAGVTLNTDIHATAKGYARLAEMGMRSREAK